MVFFSCFVLWVQDLFLFFFGYSLLYYYILSSIFYIFNFAPSFPISLFLCFQVSFALYILQLFFRDKSLSLILFWFGAFIVAPSTLHKCYNLLPCFLLSLFSSAMSLGGMPYVPLCSCTFLHKEYTGPFSSCYTFCSMATCTASSSYTLLFTLIIGHSHVLRCYAVQNFRQIKWHSTP